MLVIAPPASFGSVQTIHAEITGRIPKSTNADWNEYRSTSQPVTKLNIMAPKPAPMLAKPQMDLCSARGAWVEYLSERIPVKRPGLPNDLDGAVVFLASESSRYITGQTLLVEGGTSIAST
jgi:NAD(P)-dependent dehydrogenase (short-subunit alcohol dehydrogenase family)